MDYKSQYQRLITRAKTRTLTGYTEKHHIFPKCLGGGNSKDNIVYLTPEEHYVAHQLLVKMYPGNRSLIWSAVAMTNRTKRMARQNKLYGWLRRKFSEQMSGRRVSKETREKLSNAMKGNKSRLGQKHTGVTKEKMSSASRGKPKSEEHRKALSAAKIGKKQKPRTKQWLKNMSKSIKAALVNSDKSRYQTAEYQKKQSDQMKEIWSERKKQKGE